jgi:hypothetical protein
VNRVGRTSTDNTLKIGKQQVLCPTSAVLHTLQHRRTDQMKCIVSQLQPGRQALLASYMGLTLAAKMTTVTT